MFYLLFFILLPMLLLACSDLISYTDRVVHLHDNHVKKIRRDACAEIRSSCLRSKKPSRSCLNHRPRSSVDLLMASDV